MALEVDEETIRVLSFGTLTPDHASAFGSYVKTVRHAYGLDAILGGEAGWPAGAKDRDLLYFLAETFRARLVKSLPADKDAASPAAKQLAYRAKALLVELAEISVEIAQLVIASDDDGRPVLPTWFVVEIARDLPRLVAARG